MNMQSAIDRKMEQPALRPVREDRRLRKRAEQQGVPVFALRLMPSRRQVFSETETTLRYRRD